MKADVDLADIAQRFLNEIMKRWVILEAQLIAQGEALLQARTEASDE